MILERLITHTALAGETFDMLAYKYYGDEMKDYLITEYNDPYAWYLTFDGGEQITIPIYRVPRFDDPTLAPWRRDTE